MMHLALLAMLGSQHAPLQWSDAYWAKQTEFKQCYDDQLKVLEQKELSAKETLDGVLAACKPQWDARVAALRADIVRQRPDWSSETIDGFLDRRFREFYNLRLHRMQQAYGEAPVIVND